MSNHPLLKVEISQLSIAERIHQLKISGTDSGATKRASLTDAQKQQLDRRLENYQ